MGRNALANVKAVKLMLNDSGVEFTEGGIAGLVGFLPTTGTQFDFSVRPFIDPSQQPNCDPFTRFRTIQGMVTLVVEFSNGEIKNQ